MTDLFSILSAASIFSACIVYFMQTVKGSSTPNPVTWLIWVIIAVMNTITYFTVVNGDVLKVMMPSIHAFFLCLIFLYAMFRGKFTKLWKTDFICLILAIAVGILWKLSGDDIATNMLLQVIIISFIPTVNGLIRGHAREKPLPWFLSAVAYAFLILAISTDEGQMRVAFVFPVVRGILCSSVVFLACLQIRQTRHEKPAS